MCLHVLHTSTNHAYGMNPGACYCLQINAKPWLTAGYGTASGKSCQRLSLKHGWKALGKMARSAIYVKTEMEEVKKCKMGLVITKARSSADSFSLQHPLLHGHMWGRLLAPTFWVTLLSQHWLCCPPHCCQWPWAQPGHRCHCGP